ncbi:MAG: glycosyltransferase [Nitrospirota bacterium]
METDFSSFPPISITAYSDYYDLPEPKVWGDYWFKENLTREFLRIGYPVDHSVPGILLHLFGEPDKNISADTYNILWIHSHPDWITPEILRKYRKIYCISEYFIQKITDMGFRSERLMMPTFMTPQKTKKRYDVIFVGNTKQNRIRKIIKDLGDPSCNVKIWGWGWKGLIPDDWYGGDYYEHAKLNELYAASKIVLNDHHEDMRREGFINPRILDVLASGGFVISDSVTGMDEMLNNSVVTYNSPEDLRRLIEKYLDDDKGRELISKKGQEIALRYNFRSACSEIIRHIRSISDKLFP